MWDWIPWRDEPTGGRVAFVATRGGRDDVGRVAHRMLAQGVVLMGDDDDDVSWPELARWNEAAAAWDHAREISRIRIESMVAEMAAARKARRQGNVELWWAWTFATCIYIGDVAEAPTTLRVIAGVAIASNAIVAAVRYWLNGDQ